MKRRGEREREMIMVTNFLHICTIITNQTTRNKLRSLFVVSELCQMFSLAVREEETRSPQGQTKQMPPRTGTPSTAGICHATAPSTGEKELSEGRVLVGSVITGISLSLTLGSFCARQARQS